MTGSDNGASDPTPLLIEFLRERDVKCPLCGYNLRGLTHPVCPECGGDLQLCVGVMNPRPGIYIAIVAAWCVGLGGSLLFSLLALFAAPSDWWTEPWGILLLVQLGLSGGMLPFVLVQHRRIRRASNRWQWRLAGVAWFVVLALSTAVVVVFER